MARRHLLACSLLAAMVTGCYVNDMEPAEPRNQSKGNLVNPDSVDADNEVMTATGDCRRHAKNGCFQGQIPAAPELIVAGKSFFDADDLGHRFHELLDVVDVDGNGIADVEMKLLTPIDNRSFARGFIVNVKGPTAMGAKAWNSGRFNLNDLPSGEYYVRVSKPLHFAMTKKVKREIPAGENGQPQVVEEKVEKKYCAALHSETSITIDAQQAVSNVFDDFELYIPDQECNDETLGRILTL